MTIAAGSDVDASDFVSTPSGAADSGKVPKLNANGRIPQGFSSTFDEDFGDGNDGAYTLSNQGTAPSGITKTDNTNGATVFRLDRDIYCTNLTIDSTVTLKTNSYKIFGTGTLTNNGTIHNDGNNGGNGANVASSTGGAAVADGSLKGSGAGGNCTAGAVGDTGGSSPTVAGLGGAAGDGGAGFDNNGSGRAAGSKGTFQFNTANGTSRLRYGIRTRTMVDLYLSNSIGYCGAPGGGAGGGSSQNIGQANSGGAGGSGGGIVYIAFAIIVNNGTIRAKGGNGGNGYNLDANHCSGGGGGGGGGILVLITTSHTNTGTESVAGGTKGTKGNTAASDGNDGSTGTIYIFLA